MQPATQATYDRLAGADWFAKVGVRDADDAIVLSSWDEAIASCGSPEWEDLCLEAANQFGQRIAERSRERYAAWNDLVFKLKPIVEPLVRFKTQAVVTEHDLPQDFIATVNWDMLHLLLEAEYADVHPPGFYASQGHWYLRGHFPCGWRGVFPRGQLIVF